MMPGMPVSLHLKPNLSARVLGGHPWVFANETRDRLSAEFDGEAVECRDARGRFLGTGIYNGRSQIIWRRLSRARVELDDTYLREALAGALRRREGIAGSARAFCRLVWSESDGLPGVVVDRYGDTLVLQTQTLAMDRRQDTLLGLLQDLLRPADIVVRNDAPVRKLEGLPLQVGTFSGGPWEPRWLNIDGLDYWVDLQRGQKTGFYLDQRPHHLMVARQVARLAAERPEGVRVLDAFCNQGSFALQCAKAGASTVCGLDSSGEAVTQAKRNAERNGLRAEFMTVNVFDYFTAHREESWDLIILDPPPFAKSRGSLGGAMRGYKEINLRAMQSLSAGGVLATFSCSHHVQDVDFRAMLAEAAADAKRHVQVLEFCHQPPDHPVLVTMPESEYLRGCLLRVE